MFNAIKGLMLRPLTPPDPHVLIVRIKGEYNPKTFIPYLKSAVNDKVLGSFLDHHGFTCFKVRVRNACAKQLWITSALRANFPDLQVKVTRTFPK